MRIRVRSASSWKHFIPYSHNGIRGRIGSDNLDFSSNSSGSCNMVSGEPDESNYQRAANAGMRQKACLHVHSDACSFASPNGKYTFRAWGIVDSAESQEGEIFLQFVAFQSVQIKRVLSNVSRVL